MDIFDLLRYPLTVLLMLASLLMPKSQFAEIEEDTELISMTEHLEVIGEENGVKLPDNETPLETYDLTAYPLAELQNFFYPYTTDLINILDIEYKHSDYIPDLVNDHFPIQCMRRIDFVYGNGTSATRFYTVYKVEEGGYFYVFWNIYDGSPMIIYSGYLSKVTDIEDYDALIMNKSSFDDVYAIDPSADFRIGGSGPRSYHLLTTGELLKIEYEYTRLSDTDDLIVTGMEVLPEDNDIGYLAQVYEGDLPK